MASSKQPQLKVVVFLSSVRPNRMAERVGIHVMEAIQAKGMTPILFDPLKMGFELVKMPLHFMPNPDSAPAWLKEANEKLKTADAFLIASAEYNCGIPAPLTNMLAHFPTTSYRNRPCGIITYSPGAFGGIRCATLLRISVAEFGMLLVPTSVAIPKVNECISEKGVLTEGAGGMVSQGIGKQLNELLWFATAFKNHTAIKPLPS